VSREDIIRLAQEAGFIRVVAAHEDGSVTTTVAPIEELERFAALVAAAEREACAKVCEEMARRHDDIRRAALEVVAEWIRARKEP
jgi:predicted secreted Zn-dependent protease